MAYDKALISILFATVCKSIDNLPFYREYQFYPCLLLILLTCSNHGWPAAVFFNGDGRARAWQALGGSRGPPPSPHSCRRRHHHCRCPRGALRPVAPHPSNRPNPGVPATCRHSSRGSLLLADPAKLKRARLDGHVVAVAVATAAIGGAGEAAIVNDRDP